MLISKKNLSHILSAGWFLALSAVCYKLLNYIQAQDFIWSQINYFLLILGIIGGTVFSLPLAWLTYDYFMRIRELKNPWLSCFIITFLPMIGKYIPGKIWALAGFITQARSLAGISIKDASFFQIYVQVLSSIASTLLAMIGLTIFNHSIDPDILYRTSATTLALLIMSLISFFIMVKVADKFHHTLDSKKVIPHTLILSTQKALRATTQICFIIALMPVSHFIPEIILAFVIAMQIGTLAFFAPAGLGVTEGAYVMLLTGGLPLEQAIQVALLARIWQTVTDFLLASISFLFRMRL